MIFLLGITLIGMGFTFQIKTPYQIIPKNSNSFSKG
jgi:uncharacterized membrane protein YczE